MIITNLLVMVANNLWSKADGAQYTELVRSFMLLTPYHGEANTIRHIKHISLFFQSSATPNAIPFR